MKIYSYKPLPNINLGYAQERIVQYLKEHGEAESLELYKLSSKQSNPLNQLLEKGIVFKTDSGKYQLTKAVKLEQSKNPFKTVVSNGKIEDIEVKYFDLDEAPPGIKEGLTNVPIHERAGWECFKKDLPKK